MENNFASICVLAYKRPERLIACLNSLKETADYPYELIVNLDGGSMEEAMLLTSSWKYGEMSKLILNSGQNRGVGRSFANCIGVSEGDYLFKVDTDLTFRPKWLSTSVNILENNKDVGAVSLFDYKRNYDPKEERFNVLEEREDCKIVDDFVSSIYGFRKMDINSLRPEVYGTDDGFHQVLGHRKGKLAITKQDLIVNHGFGVSKSTYLSGTEESPYKTPTHDKPLLFGVE